MDAGLAAVLGALAGAVATTGAAFATGWATREQAKIAARAEHRRQRRDARQAVYEDFINAIDELHQKTSLIEETHSVELSPQQAGSLSDSIGKLCTKVMLAGPAHISKRASAIRLHATGLILALVIIEAQAQADTDITTETANEDWMKAVSFKDKLAQEIAGFSTDAQTVLDDDGTKSKSQ
ncbi:hypothetical protein OG542_05835 [Streptomyces violaceus]|uniref:hypothetical protein n=1 Tax=Streptomyces violaceus TaxID=1936 RepID=UPI002E1FD41C